MINNKYTNALAILYPIPTLEDDVAIENLYTPAQNPVWVAISFVLSLLEMLKMMMQILLA